MRNTEAVSRRHILCLSRRSERDPEDGEEESRVRFVRDRYTVRRSRRRFAAPHSAPYVSEHGNN